MIYLGQFQQPALLTDGALLFFLCQATQGIERKYPCLLLLGLWILFTKVLKLIPHFCRHPSDVKFIPVSIIFSYLHGFINIYALFTLHVTVWGSQNLDELKAA